MSSARAELAGLAVALASLVLAACHDNLSAAVSGATDTCYRLPTGAAVSKVALSAGDENLETCAMHVEGYRLMHALPTATGLYDGALIYASKTAITSATNASNVHYRVYTPAQKADLDRKLNTLIAQSRSGGGVGQD